jgi:two-component system, chemotaxis family, chemotaxis protein CheY
MGAIAELEILIVDDHEGMRALLRKVLERAGAVCVREATSAADALALLAERPAQLILADHMMPGMDGMAFVRHVRASADGAVRIVMITGRAEPAIAAEAQSAGVDALLVKPVAPSALIAAIERAFAA